MNTISPIRNASAMMPIQSPMPKAPAAAGRDDAEVRKQFQTFVGQTLFGQMLQSMRRTVDKPAYFHGGRAEELFQQQLDQVLTEKLTDASAETLAGPMFELFMMDRAK